ncbi:hypothetical protein [Nannocystis pusilla]|uniref:hypothetical protein n=1 Tax=Nannocystis pusilla TaxID=889268 RepID=UPI003B799A07
MPSAHHGWIWSSSGASSVQLNERILSPSSGCPGPVAWIPASSTSTGTGVDAGLVWNTRARDDRTCSHSSSTMPELADTQIVFLLGSGSHCSGSSTS